MNAHSQSCHTDESQFFCDMILRPVGNRYLLIPVFFTRVCCLVLKQPQLLSKGQGWGLLGLAGGLSPTKRICVSRLQVVNLLVCGKFWSKSKGNLNPAARKELDGLLLRIHSERSVSQPLDVLYIQDSYMHIGILLSWLSCIYFCLVFDAKAAMSKRSQQSSLFSNMFVPDMHVVCWVHVETRRTCNHFASCVFGDAGMSCAGPARTWWRSLGRSLSVRVNLWSQPFVCACTTLAQCPPVAQVLSNKVDALKGEAAKVAAKLPKSSLHLSLWTLDPLDVHRILWVFPTIIDSISAAVHLFVRTYANHGILICLIWAHVFWGFDKGRWWIRMWTSAGCIACWGPLSFDQVLGALNGQEPSQARLIHQKSFDWLTDFCYFPIYNRSNRWSE